MNTQITVNKTTNKIANKELILAFKECYLNAQKALLKETYKTEEPKEREQLKNKMQELGESYEQGLTKLKSWQSFTQLNILT